MRNRHTYHKIFINIQKLILYSFPQYHLSINTYYYNYHIHTINNLASMPDNRSPFGLIDFRIKVKYSLSRAKNCFSFHRITQLIGVLEGAFLRIWGLKRISSGTSRRQIRGCLLSFIITILRLSFFLFFRRIYLLQGFSIIHKWGKYW